MCVCVCMCFCILDVWWVCVAVYDMVVYYSKLTYIVRYICTPTNNVLSPDFRYPRVNNVDNIADMWNLEHSLRTYTGWLTLMVMQVSRCKFNVSPVLLPWSVRGVSLVCPWYVRGVSVVRPWCVRGTSVVCPWYVRGVSVVCPWSVRGTFVVCPRSVRGTFDMCSSTFPVLILTYWRIWIINLYLLARYIVRCN